MIITKEMLETMKMTEKTINILRDERVDLLTSQLNNIREEFVNIEQAIIDFHTPRAFSEHITIWTRIKLSLETHYRDCYKEKLFPRFVPFNRRNLWDFTDASIQEFYTVDKQFFVRSWKNGQWYVLPIAKGNPVNGIITVVTPEELQMNNIEIQGYSNPFLAMFAYYISLAEAVQRELGELHPICTQENCTHYMNNGRCRYQDLRVPNPDSCVLGIKGKEVK